MSATTEQKVDFLLKKVGYTLSKTGSVTGTGAISGGTTKEPFAESLPSPLVVPDSSIWNQSLSIPTTPPGSDTAIVKVYSTSSALRMTADSSVSGSRAFIAYTTYNNTSSARLTDWIDTQFGTAYVLKVYKGDPNSGGTLLPAGGSGSNDGWFFDYSSGVLNFNGSGLPSGVSDSNIYIVGYRYIGSKGVSSPGQINPTNLFVSGISTFAGLVDINAGGQANTFKVEDLTAGRVVLAGTGGEIEDSGNLTFNGTTLNSSNLTVSGVSTFTGNIDANGNLDVDGQTDLDVLNVAELATFTGNIDANGSLDVDGHTELDNLGVSGVSTFVGVGTFQNDLSVAGQLKGYTNLTAPHSSTKTFTVTVATKDASHRYNGQGSGSGYKIDGIFAPILTLTPGRTYRFTNDNTGSHPLKFYLEADKTTNYTTGVNFQNTYTEITVSDSTPNVLHYQCTAHGYMGNAIVTNSNVVNSNYAATLRGGLNVSGGETVLSSATVSDLTDNRVVIAGTSGALEDSGNLTFNGSQLGITGTVNASSTITGTEFHTGASGSAIRITSNTISGPATFTLDPAGVGDNTGKVVIAGDLQVDGTTTTVNSTTVNIVDKNIQVATGAADDAAANGGGITIASGDGNKTFQFEATGDNLGSSENLNLASGKDYKINNTSVLNATTLGSGVVNSSLTSVGTLTSLNVTGNITGAGDLTLTDTATDSAAGPELKLFRNSASPADADYLGQIKFAGESDTGVERNYAKITGKILDASNGTEDGIIEIAHIKAGSQNISARFRSDSLQLINGTNLTVAGTSTFSGNIDLPDSVSAIFGTDDDGSIKHTGTNLQIFETTGNIQITNYANDKDVVISSDDGSGGTANYFVADGSTGEALLYYYGTEKIKTTNNGVTVTGSIDANGSLDVDGHTELDNLGVSGVSTFSGNVNISGANRLEFGSDFDLYRSSGNTLLSNQTGNLIIDNNSSGDDVQIYSNTNFEVYTSDTESAIIARKDAQVELYFNDNLKLETNNTGVVVTGITSSTNGFVGNLTGNVTGTATLATDLAINGTNQIVYQSANNNSAILPTGNAGQILQSNGSGSAPQWVNSAPAGAIEGITIRDESSVVGTANSISTINFIGSVVTADAAAGAGIATVTVNAIAGLGVSEGSGSKATGATGLDFVGSVVNVDAVSNTGIATVQIDGLSIKDEGSAVGTAGSITTLNFVGNGVVADAAVAAGIATVTINAGVAVSEGSGTKATGATGLDFVGSLIGVDASSNTGISTVRVDALTIKDEGSTVGTAGSITTINFVGTGIAAAVSGGTATVTASGGATTDDVVALAIALG